METMADKVNRYFLENDWIILYKEDCGLKASKTVNFPELSGTMSNGNRNLEITLCERGRYLTIHKGFDVMDLDLRGYTEAETAVNELINRYKAA